MSKSKGKTLTIDTLIEQGFNPLSYRLMCLQSHYRKQLTFSFESLRGVENAYKKLKKKIALLNIEGEIDETKYNEFNNKFKNFLKDDLNTANAITLLYDVLKSDINDITKYELIKSFDEVLSLDLLKKEEQIVNEDYVLEKIKERNIAKKNKDYQKADQIRDELKNIGIILKDTREGTTYEVE